MKRRKKIKIVVFSTALLLSLIVWGSVSTYTAHKYKTEIDRSNEKALTELCEYMSNIEVSLTKIIYANSDTLMGELSNDIGRSSAGAKESLSQLSSGDTELYNTYKFLSQVGEFTAYLNRKAAAGEKISEEERKTLISLMGFAAELSLQFEHMASLLSADYFTFDEISDMLIKTDSGSEKTVSYLNSISDTELTFEDFPTLIYDGPYSDNILQKNSVLLENEKEISVDEAKKIAARILGTDEKYLVEEEASSGKTAAYCFRTEAFNISVTKKGGYPLEILSDSTAGEARLTQGDAIEKASLFLNTAGFMDMVSTYAASDDGICTINFAYKDGSFICYPDLIKVSVSLSDGKITGFESTDYIMNHQKRNIPAFSFTPEEITKDIAPTLEVLEISAAVIPTPSGEEKYTYELLCKNEDNQHILLYKDITTGEESDILILLYSDNGTLTK